MALPKFLEKKLSFLSLSQQEILNNQYAKRITNYNRKYKIQNNCNWNYTKYIIYKNKNVLMSFNEFY